ncbi:MAG: hypothetical protein V4683_09530 [Bacteroidota bacterium]
MKLAFTTKKWRFCATLIFTFISYFSISQTIAVIEFMKVPENGDANYIKMESEIWKPMHQKLVNDGKLLFWGLYAIPFPGGTNAEYQYATVRLFKDLAQSGGEWDFEKVFKAVHPKMDINVATKRTLDSRDLVKANRMSQWGAFFNEGNTFSNKFMTVVYINVKEGKNAEYRNIEKTMWEPMHRMEMAKGKREGWQGWALDMPWGTKNHFNHVAVDFYKDWAQFTKVLPESDYMNAAGGKKFEDIIKATNEVESVYLTEEWHLIDETKNP